MRSLCLLTVFQSINWKERASAPLAIPNIEKASKVVRLYTFLGDFPLKNTLLTRCRLCPILLLLLLFTLCTSVQWLINICFNTIYLILQCDHFVFLLSGSPVHIITLDGSTLSTTEYNTIIAKLDFLASKICAIGGKYTYVNDMARSGCLFLSLNSPERSFPYILKIFPFVNRVHVYILLLKRSYEKQMSY